MNAATSSQRQINSVGRGLSAAGFKASSKRPRSGPRRRPYSARRAGGSSILGGRSGDPLSERKRRSRSHFSGEISRHFEAGADFDNNGSGPAHGVSPKKAFPAGFGPGQQQLAASAPAVTPRRAGEWIKFRIAEEYITFCKRSIDAVGKSPAILSLAAGRCDRYYR
jgi:hypothetical protein